MGWRDLAKTELIRQYNNRGLVPDHQDFFATWDDWSEDYRKRAPKYVPDISYGRSDAEKLDLFLPDAENPPLHLFIHGYRRAGTQMRRLFAEIRPDPWS